MSQRRTHFKNVSPLTAPIREIGNYLRPTTDPRPTPWRTGTRPSRSLLLSSVLALFVATVLARMPLSAQPVPVPPNNQPVKRYAAPDYTTGGPGGAGIKPPLCQPGWSQGECGLCQPGSLGFCELNPTGEAWPADGPAVWSGGAMTHDGGLLVLAAIDSSHDLEERGLYVTAVHLDRVTIDNVTGRPDMSDAFDRPLRIMETANPSSWAWNGTFGNGFSPFVAAIFDPEVDEPGLVQPYPVDCNTWQVAPGGACRRYNLQLIINVSRPTLHDMPVGWNVPLDAAGKPLQPVDGSCLNPLAYLDNNGNPVSQVTSNPVKATAAGGLGLEGNSVTACPDTISTFYPLFPGTKDGQLNSIATFLKVQRRLEVYLDDQGEVVPFGTASTIGSAPDPRWLDQGIVRTLAFGDNGNYFPLIGSEPTLTADGRLMFWQSTRNHYEADDLGQEGGKYFSYNHDFGGATGTQQVRRAAAGYGNLLARPTGVCVPQDPLPAHGYPQGCASFPIHCLDANYADGTPCTNQVPFFVQQNLVYAYRDDPSDPHGWSRPRNLAEMYGVHGPGSGNEPLVDGVLFSERYPIAAAPITHGDGSPIDWIRGQYYWANPDGTGVLWNVRGHAGTSYVGSETHHRIVVLDGPVNPSDQVLAIEGLPSNPKPHNVKWTDRENFFAFGTSPGMWGPFLADPALPYIQAPGGERSIVLFGQQTNNLVEFQFRDNPDRILFLPMNKAARYKAGVPVDKPNAARFLTRSPHVPANYGAATDDATGNGHTGTLVGAFEAFFDGDDLNSNIIQECLDASFCNHAGNNNNREHDGFNGPRSGASVHLYGDGHVAVGGNTPYLNPAAAEFARGLSAGLFLRVIHADSTHNGDRMLLKKSNSFSLMLRGNDGKVVASVTRTDGSVLSVVSQGAVSAYTHPGGPDPQTGQFWNHIALTYGFEDGSSHLTLYVDGRVDEVAEASGDIRVKATDKPLYLGWQESAPAPDVALDEVELWSRPVAGEQVAKMAYIKPLPSGLRADAASEFGTLPLGLDASFLKLPEGSDYDLTTARVALGRDLFHETALSGSGAISCATCHEAGHFFAQHATAGGLDGFSLGAQGQILPRQTQPVINRAFGTAQFSDARAASLEEQSTLPIFSMVEMNSTPAIVDQVLNSPAYKNRFLRHYGTATPRVAELELALGAYMRNILAGDSTVDRFLAGFGVLSDEAKRGRQLFFGKARCAACHHGPNFSDERLHVTAAATTDDGAFDVSGELADWRAFKTSSLRTGGMTDKFFHNGSAADLAALISQYNAGAPHGTPPLGVSGRDPEIRPLGLTVLEVQDLQEYLEALESTVMEVHP